MTHIHTTQLAETNFLSSKNSIISFRALLKILKFGGINVFKTNVISAHRTGFFWLVEVNFFHFSDIPARKRYFLPIGNVILNNFFFIPYGGGRFSFTDISGNKFI